MRSTLFASLALSMAAACATGVGDNTIDDTTLLDAGGDHASLGDDAGLGFDGASGSDGAASDSGNADGAPSGDATSGVDSSPGTDSGGGGQRPVQGEVLITEVMYNPSGTEPDAEWFEVYNTTASSKALDGLTLTDGAARTHTIGAGVTLGAHAYAVFARLRATSVGNQIPTASILYEYGAGLTATTGIILANGANGGITMSDGATTIATSPYGGFSLTATNASLELKVLTYAGESTSASWCVAATAWAGTDKGTPGAAGDCP